MSKFISIPLQGIYAKRFDILTGYVGSADWWQKLFQNGACIAGGAAMFVADEVQCISDVGDIDVWMPRHIDMTPHIECLCQWLTENQLDHRIRIQSHMATVINPIMNVQFISATREKGIAAVLDGFDYDCVQAAIYLHVDKTLRSGHEICTLHLLCSERALDSYSTRENKWINLRRWKFNRFIAQQNAISKERIRQREDKMRRKHFVLRGSNRPQIEKHICQKEHRIPSQDYWSAMSRAESLRFEECREKIGTIHYPKRDPIQIDHHIEYMRSQNTPEDEIQEYILGFLDSLKLDDETFKTAKTQMEKDSENQWVLAPSAEDKQRQNLQHRLHEWRIRYPYPTLSQKYALRNLALLVDSAVKLEEVKASILSDGLKCNPNCQEFAMGLYFDAQQFGVSVGSLFTLIERTFL